MEFVLSRAIQLAMQVASRSATSSRAAWSQTWFPTSRRQVRAISTCRDSSNLAADRFAAGLQPASDLLVSRIAPDRPNSSMLSSSLAAR